MIIITPDGKKVMNGTTYHKDTPLEVVHALEVARMGKVKVRVWYGENGVSWDDENDTIGRIGRSCGTVKIPLLIKNKRSMGGGLLDHCIVKIVDVNTRHIIWQHAKFSQTYFGADDTLVWKGRPGTGETIYATCKTPEQAKSLASFMNGERMAR